MRLLTISLLSICFLAALVHAADTKITTVITVGKLHCSGCAKKIEKRLKEVANVSVATVNLKTSQATITPVKDKKLSPKSLWEAVESTGYKPTKLVGPSGEFTRKPSA